MQNPPRHHRLLMIIALLGLGSGCSKGDSTSESSPQGSAAKGSPTSPTADPKLKEALTADFKTWVEKTYTTEPHKLVDIAGRETPITCKLEPSIEGSTLEGVLALTAVIGERTYPFSATFQKGDGGWTCSPDDPKEEVKWNARNCETVAQYCARNPPPPKITSLWEYSEKEDKMRGAVTKMARLKSLNEWRCPVGC